MRLTRIKRRIIRNHRCLRIFLGLFYQISSENVFYKARYLNSQRSNGLDKRRTPFFDKIVRKTGFIQSRDETISSVSFMSKLDIIIINVIF